MLHGQKLLPSKFCSLIFEYCQLEPNACMLAPTPGAESFSYGKLSEIFRILGRFYIFHYLLGTGLTLNTAAEASPGVAVDPNVILDCEEVENMDVACWLQAASSRAGPPSLCHKLIQGRALGLQYLLLIKSRR